MTLTAEHTGVLTDEEKQAQRWLVEHDFGYFLKNFVRVKKPPVAPGMPENFGLINFTMWPHMEEIVHLLTDVVNKDTDDPNYDMTLVNDRIVWLKARQIGATTILAAYALWRCYAPNTEGGMFSQGEDEAVEFLGKGMLNHHYLPAHLQMEIIKDNTTVVQFANGSRLRAYPSTKRAGRGATFSFFVMDEADFHEYYDTSYGTLMPTVDAGGQAIIVSTSNHETLNSGFKRLYRESVDKHWTPVFFSWKVVPGRDAQWLADRKAESMDDVQFEKEYPSTADEALSASIKLASFVRQRLDDMRNYDVRKVLKTVGINGKGNIYQLPRPGQRYIAGSDVSLGVELDFSVTVIMERDTGVIVADLMDNTLEAEDFALESLALMDVYGSPLWGIEDNDNGKTVIKVVELKRYPNRKIYRGKTAGGRRLEGWHTDEVSRRLLWNELKMAVRSGQIHIPNEAGIDQFASVYRNPKNRGRDEALGGAHDDYPFAVGICWQMRELVFSFTETGKRMALPSDY